MVCRPRLKIVSWLWCTNLYIRIDYHISQYELKTNSFGVTLNIHHGSQPIQYTVLTQWLILHSIYQYHTVKYDDLETKHSVFSAREREGVFSFACELLIIKKVPTFLKQLTLITLHTPVYYLQVIQIYQVFT